MPEKNDGRLTLVVVGEDGEIAKTAGNFSSISQLVNYASGLKLKPGENLAISGGHGGTMTPLRFATNRAPLGSNTVHVSEEGSPSAEKRAFLGVRTIGEMI